MNRDIFDIDPELFELFPGEPDLLDLARRVRASRPEAPLGSSFQAYLRARLMDEAPRALRPRLLRRLRLRGGVVAGGFATVGLAMAVIAVVSVLHGGGGSSPPPVYALGAQLSIQAGRADVDPENAITISFNQPMDHLSVAQALHIEPATTYTVHWDDHTNTVTIVPAHHLAASTAYVVRLDTTARSTNGVALPTAVTIPFGTRPLPSAPPSPPPTPPSLVTTVLGQALPTSPLVATGDGGVLAGAGFTPSPVPAASLAPGVPTASPSGSPSPTATATATASAAPPSAAPASASPAPALLRIGGQVTSPTALGATTTALAVSPAGRAIVALVPDGDHADVVTSRLDGSGRRTLTTHADAASPLAWTASGVLYISGGRVSLVGLEGGPVRVLAVPVLVPGGSAVLVRDGQRVVVLSEPSPPTGGGPTTTVPSPSPSSPAAAASPTAGPTSGADLVDLASGATTVLPGAVGPVAASPQGGTVVWAVRAGSGTLVERADVAAALGGTLTPRPVPLSADVTDVIALAVDDAGTVAATVQRSSGAVGLEAVDKNGHLVGTAPALDRPVVVAPGTVVGLARSTAGTPPRAPGAVDIVAVGLSNAGAQGAPMAVVPAAAGTLLDRVVAAQAPPSAAALTGIPVAGSDPPNLVAITPAEITQAYAVTATPSQAGATVIALVRLVHISAAPDQFPTAADETLTLSRQPDGTFAVTRVSVSQPAPQASGPHLQHVDVAGEPGARVVTFLFDGDLDPASAGAAVSVSGLPTGSSPVVMYDASRRAVVVTLPTAAPAPSAGTVVVTVGTGLRDINGVALAQPASASVPPEGLP